MSRVGVFGMLAHGVRGTRERLGLVAKLYAVQLAVGLLFTVVVGWTLSSLYGNRPLFDRGVAGDDMAMVLALTPHMAVHTALIYCGVGLALGYACLSFYLTAGLIGSFAGLPFGTAAGRWFFTFLRLWLWSLIPYAVGAVALVMGVRIASIGLEDAVSLKLLVGRPLLGAAPGLLVLALTACAVDYARIVLVAGERFGALRALLRGFATIFTRPAAFAHFLVYLLFWIAVSAIYVAITFGHSYGGVVGFWLLFGLRQLVSIVRFSARVATVGGQTSLLSGTR